MAQAPQLSNTCGIAPTPQARRSTRAQSSVPAVYDDEPTSLQSATDAPSTAARRASARSRTSKAEAAVVEEAATESVPEAPSTAARRASARSRTSKIEPAVAEEAAAESTTSATIAGSALGGDDSILDIDDTSIASSSFSGLSIASAVVRAFSSYCLVIYSCTV